MKQFFLKIIHIFYFRIQNENTSQRKRHTCLQCNKSFTTFSSLKKHIEAHTRRKRYSGQDKKIPVFSDRKPNVQLQDGKKALSCSERQNIVLQPSDLKQPGRVPCKEEPYKCSDCTKSFSTAGNLRQHKMIHSGEKPFCCSLCTKRFT